MLPTLLLSLLVAGSAAHDVTIHDVDSLLAALAPLSQSAAGAGGQQRRRLLTLATGDFVLGRTLSLPSGTTLRGGGGGEAVLRLAEGVAHPVVVIYNASGGVLLSGVRIAGHNVSRPQRAPALVVLGGAGVTLERLTVSGGVHIGGGLRHTLTRS